MSNEEQIAKLREFSFHASKVIEQQERLIALLFEKVEELREKQIAGEAAAKEAARWWSIIMSVGTGVATAFGKKLIGVE